MTVFYKGGGWEVTHRLVRTPKKSFDVGKIESVSLKRNLFLMCALPSLGLLGLGLSFWRYLYAGEQVALIALPIVVLAVTWQVGTLKVDSLALRDDEGGTIYGRFSRLLQVRRAIEQAMDERREVAS
ncbi:hypothetical protein B7H23_07640 [Notoacmeibacter marinus]|uniref:Uncharacterized protein n=1 Tax=Notoacmeibacter marinus TaxID=1876515 RepID=A0A231V564_9HYPH|nr:hypothetical protein [Notoacmeibacter marinus]OXT02736.1 hypothetical protein B7H23_07640 [Notoacmeibacter marinus]